MALLNLFRKTSSGPYKNEGLNRTYDLLFCDDIGLYKNETKGTGYPWDILLAENPDLTKLKKVTADKNLESRQRLLAYRLVSAQEAVTEKELLGVVVEIGLRKGLDVLAAFSDGSARYFNHAEKLLVWENRTAESDALVARLFNEGVVLAKRLGSGSHPRRPPPGRNMARLSLLVSDGLCFGEGPFDDLQNDPNSAPVINATTQLLAFLIKQATPKE
jgi:hypothetical protein